MLDAMSTWTSTAGFYLAGGTAAALYMGHRRSIDLDYFGPDDIADPASVIARIEDCAGKPFEPRSVGPGTIVGAIGGVSISFFRYRYDLLDEPRNWKGCSLISLDDLAAMKLATIYDRNTRRDFIDVHFLMRDHAPLSRMIELFRTKYPGANVAHLLTALTSFDEADRMRMPIMLVPLRWDHVKRDIRRAVETLG